MAGISISLPTSTNVNPEKQSLKYLITRINEQKGGFRNVSEQSLEEEIAAGTDDDAMFDDETNSRSDEDVEDIKSKRERVSKAREEMLKQIGQAQNESATALDFISLLLTQRTPGPASLTLSPFIKQHLPLGCLGVEVIQRPDEPDAQKEKDELVSMGWRMQSLNDAAQSLLKSAARLECEIDKETSYWDQVLVVKNKGWPLSRLPREKHTLGVRYGFSEAHPTFHDKGLAALRLNEDRLLGLDRGYKSSNSRLSVRRLQLGKATAMAMDHETTGVKNRSLEHDILEARSSIFDEELFHELHREAQYLANQGVKCIDKAILLPFGKDGQLAIALESPETLNAAEISDSDHSCNATSLTLRLLLALAHLQNLRERSQPPPPLRQGHRARPTHPILRPIIEILHHRSRMNSTWQLMTGLSACTAKAGLPLSLEVSASSSKESKAFDIPSHSDPTRMRSVWDLIANLTSNILRLRILHQDAPLSVQVHTSISPPNFGTTYYIFRGFEPSAEQKIFCSSQQDLELEMSDLLKNAIQQHIASAIPAWNDAEVGVQLITKYNSRSKSRDSLVVSINRHQLELTWSRSSDFGHQEQKWAWYADASRHSDKATLRNVLETLEES